MWKRSQPGATTRRQAAPMLNLLTPHQEDFDVVPDAMALQTDPSPTPRLVSQNRSLVGISFLREFPEHSARERSSYLHKMSVQDSGRAF